MPDLKPRRDKARVFLISIENDMGIAIDGSDLAKAISSRMLLQILPGKVLAESAFGQA